MKKRCLSILLGAILLLLVPMTVSAQPVDEPYVVLDGNVLTFYYDANRASRAATATATYDVPVNSRISGTPWSSRESAFDSVESVVIDASFKNYDALESTCNWFNYTGTSPLKSITGLGNINTTNLTDIDRMFSNLKNLETVDFGDFEASSIVTAESLFSSCEKLTTIDVSGLDTSNIESMRSMFNGCKALTEIDVSHFDTSKVENMNGMFFNCNVLQSLDVSGFDTSNVTDMASMFNGCKALTEIDVSGFDTSNVTNMTSMFLSCSSLTKLDISSFSTEAGPEIKWMFADCAKLERIYAGETWKAEECTGNTPFASCSANLKGGLNTSWNSTDTGKELAQIDGGTSDPGYFCPVVTVKADDIQKTCGEGETLTAQQNGAYSGDKVTYTLSRTDGEAVGTYTITPTGDMYQGAYKVVYQTGTLTISHKKLEAVQGKDPLFVAGYKACFKCGGCDTYFEDESGEDLIGDETAYEAWIAEDGEGYLPKTLYAYDLFADVEEGEEPEEVEEGDDTFTIDEDGIHVYGDDIVFSGETNLPFIMENDSQELYLKDIVVDADQIITGLTGSVILHMTDATITGQLVAKASSGEDLYLSIHIDGDNVIGKEVISDGSITVYGEGGATLSLKSAQAETMVYLNHLKMDNMTETYQLGTTRTVTPTDETSPVVLTMKKEATFPWESEYKINEGKPFGLGEEIKLTAPTICDENGEAFDPQPELDVAYYVIDDQGTMTLLDKLPTEAGNYCVAYYIKEDQAEYYGSGSYNFTIMDLDVVLRGTVSIADYPVADATVEVYSGEEKVAETKTNANGIYWFKELKSGTYNLVVNGFDTTKTVMITIAAGKQQLINVALPYQFQVNSEVTFAGETPKDAKSDSTKIVIGGLEDVAEKYYNEEEGQEGFSVVFQMKVETNAEGTEAAQTAIKEKAGNAQKMEYLELTLLKQVDEETSVNIGDENDQLLTIVIPFNYDHVLLSSIAVYRYHDTAEALKKDPGAGEEGFIVNKDAETITIKAKKFSTYAIGYEEMTTPPTGDTGNTTLWAVLLLISGATLTGTIVYGRKKKEEI